MKSERCKIVVKNELERLGLNYAAVELGVVKFKSSVAKDKIQILGSRLKGIGLEIKTDDTELLIKKIKEVIVKLVSGSNNLDKTNISEYISKQVNYDYTYISNLFSSSQQMTIERYVILQKIKRVKELLIFSKLTLNDIAFNMNYSSVAHLSNQFKSVTGQTPTTYREINSTRKRQSKNSFKKYKIKESATL